MGEDAHRAHTPLTVAPDVAGGCGAHIILDILGEKHYQLCPALEGVKDPCWGRPRRAGKSTGGESEVQGDLRLF